MMGRAGLFGLAAVCVALWGAAAIAAESGDIDVGEKIFKKNCKSCHQVGANAKNRVGPQLNGLFGRQAGSVEGFRY